MVGGICGGDGWPQVVVGNDGHGWVVLVVVGSDGDQWW